MNDVVVIVVGDFENHFDRGGTFLTMAWAQRAVNAVQRAGYENAFYKALKVADETLLNEQSAIIVAVIDDLRQAGPILVVTLGQRLSRILSFAGIDHVAVKHPRNIYDPNYDEHVAERIGRHLAKAATPSVACDILTCNTS